MLSLNAFPGPGKLERSLPRPHTCPAVDVLDGSNSMYKVKMLGNRLFCAFHKIKYRHRIYHIKGCSSVVKEYSSDLNAIRFNKMSLKKKLREHWRENCS